LDYTHLHLTHTLCRVGFASYVGWLYRFLQLLDCPLPVLHLRYIHTGFTFGYVPSLLGSFVAFPHPTHTLWITLGFPVGLDGSQLPFGLDFASWLVAHRITHTRLHTVALVWIPWIGLPLAVAFGPLDCGFVTLLYVTLVHCLYVYVVTLG